TETSELFDLAADLSEARDLAPERPERAAELRAGLFRWLDAVGAERPRRR
ncbi:MAG: N-acetylgalactosamine-6-sulfatase, partial [Planctomycetes bacterium]|nr:N-acetylgalactosamine-6-sulfatase [Planctomycetota bacterium]